ncbi:MAG: lysophospholipid acyltransferase family protein [Verrucomicrobiales bacterium]
MVRLPVKAERRRLSTKAKVIGSVAAGLIRLFALTYRWRLHDPEGIATNPPEKPMIWTFWHNRIFAVPVLYRKYLGNRSGAILTSASGDGEIIAATVEQFGCATVRGSSSRRGATALLGLIDWIQDGYDVAIVPDGPRGPRYRMGPGVIKLAETTGSLILPIRIEYGSKWTFDSWDRFQLPKPFSTVNVFFEPCHSVKPGLGAEAFEAERVGLENAMNPAHETD